MNKHSTYRSNRFAATSQDRCRGKIHSLLAPLCRRGLATVEVLAAIAILSIILGLAAKMSVAISSHRKTIEQHRVSLDAKTNLMNYAMALPYDLLSESELESLAVELGPTSGKWDVSVVDVQVESLSRPGQAKRISIDLDVGQKSPVDKLRHPLVAWRYPDASSTSKGVEE